MDRLVILAAFATSFLPTVCAVSNGMDMSMDGSMSLAVGEMLPYLHFTPGDMLWFLGWVPESTGAMVGTCIGLFLLALVERWIAACGAVMEAHWRKSARIAQADRADTKLPVSTRPDPKCPNSSSSSIATVRSTVTMRGAPPFILAHDLSRGIVHATQSTLKFAFMLVVMTFQVSFIIAIVVGLGVGETLFGRYASHARHLA
ncbi:CTR copper uptake transporter [Obba rivulosa]|uniref:Copper transport protein n=1 Tax=Obba rivulosa TaxID=1052685 RepID=A0A8E2AKM7_9APHY|nr:CTR copper uptake transporter [Obba rivulosa]